MKKAYGLPIFGLPTLLLCLGFNALCASATALRNDRGAELIKEAKTGLLHGRQTDSIPPEWRLNSARQVLGFLQHTAGKEGVSEAIKPTIARMKIILKPYEEAEREYFADRKKVAQQKQAEYDKLKEKQAALKTEQMENLFDSFDSIVASPNENTELAEITAAYAKKEAALEQERKSNYISDTDWKELKDLLS